jgi:hypothetical protein
MWIAGFKYVVASTHTVQSIMQQNQEKAENKLKKQTALFVKEKIIRG